MLKTFPFEATGRFLAVAACACLELASQHFAFAQTNASSRPSTPVEVMHNSVVMITGTNPGSGFIVSDEGHVVTGWHVIAKLEGNDDSTVGRYLPHVFYLRNFSPVHTDCVLRAELVGASEFQDIAVLRIIRADWESKRQNPCRKHLAPAAIEWNPDIASILAEDSNHISLAGVPKYCWDSKALMISCAQELRYLVRRQDEQGYLETLSKTHIGMSGGPAVMPNGKVIGITVMTGATPDGQVPTAYVKPMYTLTRAFWTFGIMPSAMVRDYTGDLSQILDRTDLIVELIDLLPELRRELDEMQWYPATVVESGSGEEITERIVLPFSKKSPKSYDASMFVVRRRCNLRPGIEFPVVPPGHEAVTSADSDIYSSIGSVRSYNEQLISTELLDKFSHFRSFGKALLPPDPAPDGSENLKGSITLSDDVETIREYCARWYTRIVNELEGDQLKERISIDRVGKEQIDSVDFFVETFYDRDAGRSHASDPITYRFE